MRLAFWHRSAGELVEAAAADPSSHAARAADLHTFVAILSRRKWLILGPTLLALLLSAAIVSMITPCYQSEARLLIDNAGGGTRESIERALLSRDLARDVIEINKLMQRPEFDPVRGGLPPLKALATLVGIARDPLAQTPEQRVLSAYFERVRIEVGDGARGLVVAFQSRDPELAARVANAIAERYLTRQQQARAEAQAAQPRVPSAISSISAARSPAEPPSAELTAELANARAQKSEAEAKVRLIQDALQGSRPIEVAAALNSETLRKLAERRAMLRAELAQQSLTLLDGHPRIKELKAQVSELDRQIRAEAARQAQSFEHDARLAADRIDHLSASLDNQRRSNAAEDPQLVDREIASRRALSAAQPSTDREAAAVDDARPEVRIVAPAVVSTTPAFPRKLPIVLIATLGTLLLSAGVTVTRQWPRPAAPAEENAEDGNVSPSDAAAAAPPKEPPASDEATPAQNNEIAEPTCSSSLSAVLPDTHPELAAAVGDLEALAAELREAEPAARKLTFLGARPPRGGTMTALTLARLLSRRAKVVLVDLAPSSPALRAISTDPGAPGLAELMRGQTSFGQIITRDRFSQLHLMTTGQGGTDRALLGSPRLNLVLDALLRVYDHVLLEASAATDLSAELLSANAHAIVVPDQGMTTQAQARRRAQLSAVGFAEVTMLNVRSTTTIAQPQLGDQSAAA